MSANRMVGLAIYYKYFYPDFVVLLLSQTLRSEYQTVGYDNNKMIYGNKARFEAFGFS